MDQNQNKLKRIAGIVTLALLYYAAARIGLGFSIKQTNTSPVWPASGVAIAGVLLFGWRVWPGIWLGSFAANAIDINTTQPASFVPVLWLSAIIATASTLMALAGIFICTRWLGLREGDTPCRGPLFGKINVFSFIALTFGICLISASIGSTTICAFGIAPWRDHLLLWFTWWFGDVTGILIVTPFLLAWSVVPREGWPLRLLGETALAFGVLTLICWIVFSGRYSSEGRALPVAFLTVPPLVWIALRCGPYATASALLLLSALTTWQTAHLHVGPMIIATQNASLLLLLSFLLTLAIVTHALESDSTARRLAEALNKELNINLERRVRERTLELEMSYQRYQLVTANLPNTSVSLFDHDLRYILADGTITLKACGLSKESLEGKTLREAIPAEAAQALEPHYRAALAGSAHQFEILFAGRNFTVYSLPVRDAQGQVVSGMAMGIDVTAEKQAESALRASERFAHATIDALSAHICVIDEAGTILSVNRAWRDFAKANPPVPMNCAEGTNYLDACDRATGPYSKESAPFAAGIRAVIAGECPEFSMEYPCNAPFEKRWFVGRVTRFPQGPPYCSVVAHEEITQRKLAEEALRKSEERFHAFMHHLPGVAFMKDRAGKYVYSNEQCKALFHLTPSECLGTTAAEHVPGEIAGQISKADELVFESGIPSIMVRDIPEADGVHHWLLYRFPIVDETGARTLLGAIAVDITDRVRAEQNVEAALKKEVVLKREIHHRVKNSLQVVISLLYLQSALVTDPAALEILRECQSRIRSIALIYALLSHSKDLSSIEFSQYARQLMADLFTAYQVSQEKVAITIQAEEVFISVDTALPCGLIITELVSNAFKYSFPSGRKGRIQIQLRPAESGSLELTVADDGVGLPEGFDANTAQSMGLTLVRDLVRQLDGTISFQSDRGTKVRITFPVS